jgi:putative flavoprotein involved in K+ transport
MGETVIVVGGGAAGLAAGWHLRRSGADFTILDGGERTGDSWRSRYPGLRLFTPAAFCALPGLPMPLPPSAYPGKDELGDYLSAYAHVFDLPVRHRIAVSGHRWVGGRHEVLAGGLRLIADRLIVATGACRSPAVPAWAGQLDPSIRQLHSSEYRGPAGLRPGRVLVVGAGQAGADIALSLAGHAETLLSGRSTGHVPLAVVRSGLIRRAVYRRRVPRVLGRYLRRRGSPLVWQTERLLKEAGVVRVARAAGLRLGRPVLADGSEPPVANVVWCTGFRPDYGWLAAGTLGADGRPLHRHGLSTVLSGLGFVGMPFQYTFSSGFLAGMDTDAARVVGGG